MSLSKSGCAFSYVCILTGGPDRVVVVDGKEYLFEDHPRLGPMPLNKDGSERKSRVPNRFYEAVACWTEQGKAISSYGKCVWRARPDPLKDFIHLEGKHWLHKDSPPPPGWEKTKDGFRRVELERKA